MGVLTQLPLFVQYLFWPLTWHVCAPNTRSPRSNTPTRSSTPNSQQVMKEIWAAILKMSTDEQQLIEQVSDILKAVENIEMSVGQLGDNKRLGAGGTGAGAVRGDAVRGHKHTQRGWAAFSHEGSLPGVLIVTVALGP